MNRAIQKWKQTKLNLGEKGKQRVINGKTTTTILLRETYHTHLYVGDEKLKTLSEHINDDNIEDVCELVNKYFYILEYYDDLENKNLKNGQEKKLKQLIDLLGDSELMSLINEQLDTDKIMDNIPGNDFKLLNKNNNALTKFLTGRLRFALVLLHKRLSEKKPNRTLRDSSKYQNKRHVYFRHNTLMYNPISQKNILKALAFELLHIESINEKMATDIIFHIFDVKFNERQSEEHITVKMVNSIKAREYEVEIEKKMEDETYKTDNDNERLIKIYFFIIDTLNKI